MQRFLILVAAVLVGACGQRDAGRGRAPTGPMARVLVDSLGGVRLNGHAATLAELADSLRDVRARDGAVIYSREAPDREPPPAQASTVHQVMRLIIDARLPVRLVRPESLATAGR